MKRLSSLMSAFLCASLCPALLGQEAPPAANPSDSSIVANGSVLEKAVFCKSLNSDQSPNEPTTDFAPEGPVRLSLALSGHRTSGVVAVRFLFRGEVVTETSVDLSQQKEEPNAIRTFAGFTLKPDEPLPISDQYVAEATFDGQKLGLFKFSIQPPAGALSSQVDAVAVAKSPVKQAKEAETLRDTAEFAPTDTVCLTGIADMGKLSWLQAEWTIDGKLDDAATQSLKWRDNRKDAVFSFKHRPEGGWKAGSHSVVLLLNGRQVAQKTFKILAPAESVAEQPMGPPKAKRVLLCRDDEGKPGEAVDAFSAADRTLYIVVDLENPLGEANGEVIWTILQADGGYQNVEMARAPLADNTKGANRLSSRFTATRQLPFGRYKVQLMSGGTEVAAKEFNIKAK